jgi:chromosomal replication initiation ATPase DnaA
MSERRQLVLDLGHRAALGAEDFLIAPSNEAAVAWLDRWPDWPAPALVVHGTEGSGKTHLCHVFAAKSRAACIAGDALTLDALPALASSPAVAVDDAERAGETTLLHLYNLVAEAGGRLLLTARFPAQRWATRLPDLRSRLLALPASELAPPDDALLAAVLLKLFAERQVTVAPELVGFLVRTIERSFGAARDAVRQLDAAALAAGRPITIPLAREVLRAGIVGEEDRG